MPHLKCSFRSVSAAVALAGSALLAAFATAQPSGRSPLAPPANGPRRADPTAHVFVNATIHPRPGESFPHGAVYIRDGRIERIAHPFDAEAATTDGYRVWDCQGLHIYPGFIDPFVEVDAPQPDPNTPGVHWNARVTPQRHALDGTGPDERTAESLRKLGFTAAAIAPRGGIFRGQSAVVSLAKPATDASADRPPVYRDTAYHTLGFDTRGGPRGSSADSSRWSGYPNSQMGAIALIRQTLIDADWQQAARAAGEFIAPNALDALASHAADAESPSSLPLVFVTADELESIRAAKIAAEFDRRAVILGSGAEFRRLDAIAKAGLPHIIPLNFPRTPDVSTIGAAEATDLRELMTWEQAPTNPRRLDAAGLKIALTSAQLRNRDDFTANLAKAIEHGLAPERAMAMLTTVPAELLGVADRLGTLEPGKVANLVIADGDLFKKPAEAEEPAAAAPAVDQDAPAPESKLENPEGGDPAEPQPGDAAKPQAAAPAGDNGKENAEDKDADRKAKIRDVWIDGVRHEINPAPGLELEGTWAVTLEPAIPDAITFEIAKGNAITIKSGEAEAKARGVRLEDRHLSFTFDHAPFGDPGVYHITAVVEGKGDDTTIRGRGVRSDGRRFTWTARKSEPGAQATGPSRRPDRPRAAANPASPTGLWRITEADGQPRALDAADGLTLEIKRDALTLTFTRPNADPLVIEADDVKIEGKTVTFTHTLKPFGMEGVSTDALTIDGDALTGESTLPDGSKHTYKARRQPDRKSLAGAYAIFSVGGRPVEGDHALFILTEGGGAQVLDEHNRPMGIRDLSVSGDALRFTLELGGGIDATVAGRFDGDLLTGTTSFPGGSAPPWEARRLTDKQLAKRLARVPETYGYPFGTYEMQQLPPQRKLLITNATIWTSGPQGVIQNGWIAIDGGKIAALGDGEPPAGDWQRLDAQGKHITPGLIDCHSHTGISRGVNESGQAITAEVRIADVTDPDAISWYRQLASGVTTVNSLHGSANAIGGQNQVNKIRWGVPHPDMMHFEGAPPGIKFALGENPTGANWSEGRGRYPQTRMGVETLIRDRFTAAREYAQGGPSLRDGSRRGAAGHPQRRDLELEALAEILAGERLVHCHSYRQDEILMLCRVAADFGFKIGTFQHVLEGYKVADEIAEHAIGGSCFTDWWAYKVEVQDAIPQNGPIMHEQGVLVSFNSDSDELARRLNWEAAKAVKYGGISEEEALKFVTINPAIQLKIDGRVGSLEVGKDADLAVWSGPPLSSFSRCVATYVDGREFFSLEQDAAHRKRIAAERQRIIQKILASGESGGARAGRGRTINVADADNDDRAGMLREYYLDLMNRGYDPEAARPGECGCGLEHSLR